MFKEPDIKDELSLLSSLFAKPSLLYVLRKELNSLPSDQLEQLSALDGISFKGELFREQGLRTEDLDKRREFFKGYYTQMQLAVKPSLRRDKKDTPSEIIPQKSSLTLI